MTMSASSASASHPACNLARLTHAPRLNLIYESGTLETRPDVLPQKPYSNPAALEPVAKNLRIASQI